MLLALLLQAAETPPLAPLEHITRRPCDAGKEGEVVVCGGRPDRYRLPYPIEREDPKESREPRPAAGLVVSLGRPSRK